jgi:CheY-like chemotaxis protein/HPt (histidine-containing phosphotransfer) domain-containing protein
MLLNNRILLVEDSDSDRFLFSRYLTQLGYECDCFENGKELIDQLDNYPSSLVLLDIELPIMNGIETALHVRKHFNDDGKRFILIGLTSHNDPDVLEEIASSGFDNCLHKPIRRRELEIKLQQYIKRNMSQINNNHEQEANFQGKNRLYSLEMFEADDPEFLQSIVGMFVSSTPDALNNMRQAFNKKDWEQLRMYAHKLKPHFNYFMITEAASALQEIEEISRHVKDLDKIPTLLQSIENIGLQVIEQLKADYPDLS